MKLHRQQNSMKINLQNLSLHQWLAGKLPLCKRCILHHTGHLAMSVVRFAMIGHQTKYCKKTGPQESILRDELATLETTLEDIQVSS
ncbi:hypothetical protein Tco_0762365 [Tanacetum coccineum]